MNQNDAKYSYEYLKETAYRLGVTDIATPLLSDPRFEIWSGSSKPIQHHYGKNGLVIHTAEVVRLCLLNAEALKLNIQPQRIFLSALYHDAGKMWDYRPLDAEHKEWEGTSHKRHIHHISRSAMFFKEVANKCQVEEEFVDDVLHAILAHHGLREWGSPVSPNTQLAWLLHLCDGISARMDDANKWDHTK
jgi:3'-5' exoribonuclease